MDLREVSGRPPGKAWHTFAIVTVGMTFLLILMGALVTNNDAGDSIPDWPLAYGSVVPVTHLRGPALYEYFHRVMGGTVGLLTIILSAGVVIRERRASTRILAVVCVCWLAVQAILGGVRVRLGESNSFVVAAIHAFSAEVFLGILAALTVTISPRWWALGFRQEVELPRGLVWLASAMSLSVLLQSLLGAGFRHRIFGILPHAAGAVLVSLLVVLVSVAVHRKGRVGCKRSTMQLLFTPIRIALWIAGVQLLLGLASYALMEMSSAHARLAPVLVIVSVAHLGLGSALLVDTIVFWLRALRLRMSWRR
ncbi:MAG TPA: COX15/CtaA family protein [Spirochaetia bacterium]|nr:COX15/CtaA family protein [Spirochaetia bacterium]